MSRIRGGVNVRWSWYVEEEKQVLLRVKTGS